ncbi:helix-turn-helix domain-containing protein [Chitinophaga arvensicola]|uniref:helix-turn-helix domain-containing protein n=1 Tax=Chitinophaga arvensicola TaxID=29529 RepID=UPI000B7E4C5E|nr:helix-turn-helix transcriptional regulator [Chitinophaga arvensicola]
MDTEVRKKSLGEKLRKLRDERDLSLRELAALADTDYSQIHRIEIGQISPTAITLENLAEALKVKPCVFFDC